MNKKGKHHVMKKTMVGIMSMLIMTTPLTPLSLTENAGLVVKSDAASEIPDGYTPIYSIEDLYSIRSAPDKNYILMNDIDLSETAKGGDWDIGTGWSPIPQFSGVLDGNGYNVIGMHIYTTIEEPRDDTWFGFISYNSGVLKDIYFKDVNIDIERAIKSKAYSHGFLFGGIAGYNKGVITRCSVEGNMKFTKSPDAGLYGDFSLAGLVAENSGNISQCYVDMSIETNDDSTRCVTAGLACFLQNGSIVEDCYNFGNNCALFYNAQNGWSDIPPAIYRLVNYGNGRVGIEEGLYSYYLKSDSLFYPNTATTGVKVGTPIAPALFRIKATYTNFDFDNVWQMSSSKGRAILKQHPQVSVTDVSIATLPDQLQFEVNTDFNVDGGRILVVEDDGNSHYVDMKLEMVSGIDTTKAGKQTVTITYKGYELTYDIDVTEKVTPVESISLSDETIRIEKGLTKKITATVLPVDADDKNITWTTSNADIVSVNDMGIITANKWGKAVVYATTTNGVSAACEVTVFSNITEMYMSLDTMSLCKDSTGELEVILWPNDVNEVITWASTNESVATVENGKVTAKGVGRCIISASISNGLSAKCVVTVTNHNIVTDNAKDATCGSSGLTEGSHCSLCEKVIKKQTIVPALSHQYIAAETTPATYTATGVKTYTCKNCHDTYTEKIAKLNLPFTDVKLGSWHETTVRYMLDNKLMSGKTATTFEPATVMNRGQLVTVLWNLSGKPSVSGTMPFSDVASSSAFYKAIIWASQNKIVNGYASGEFKPKDPLTRQQIATILYNYAKYRGYKPANLADINSFKDIDVVSASMVTQMRWAVGNKIISGKSSGTMLDPKGEATRIEVAAMIMNFCKNIIEKK